LSQNVGLMGSHGVMGSLLPRALRTPRTPRRSTRVAVVGCFEVRVVSSGDPPGGLQVSGRVDAGTLEVCDESAVSVT